MSEHIPAKNWLNQQNATNHLQKKTTQLLGNIENNMIFNDTSSASLLLKAVRYAASSLKIAPETIIEKTAEQTYVAEDFNAHLELISTLSNLPMCKISLLGNWYQKDSGAMISFLKTTDNRLEPIALTVNKKNQYTLYNPKTETKELVSAKNVTAILPNAWMLYYALPQKSLNTISFLKFCFNFVHTKDIFAIILSLILGSLLSMVLPKVTGDVFDKIIPQVDFEQLIIIGLILLSITISKFILQMLQSVALINTEGTCDVFVQGALNHRLINMKPAFFKNFSVGELADYSYSFHKIRVIFSSAITGSFTSAVFSLSSCFMLFYYNLYLAFAVIAVVILYILINCLFFYFDIRFNRRIIAETAKLTGWLFQIINGIPVLRLFAAEQKFTWLWAVQFVKQRTLTFQKCKFSIFSNMFFSCWQTLTTVLVYYMLIYVNSGKMSTGDFIAFNTAFGTFFSGMIVVQHSILKLINILPLYERLKPLLKEEPELTIVGKQINLSGAITLDNVNFAYSTEGKKILHNISLKITPGSFIAFVGPSGSGKSTLLRILLGFEEIQSGVILYDNLNLKELNIRYIRKQCGTVMQNGSLITGDIFQNIVSIGGKNLQDAWQAAKMAGIDEDIQKMPMGMFTLVSEGGGNLSGGQRQRLLIARALVNNPKIVLFDEATSALDNISQKIVMESLKNITATKIVIAHRLSTIREADYIYVLKDGQISECGTFDELMQINGHFSEMAKRQLT